MEETGECKDLKTDYFGVEVKTETEETDNDNVDGDYDSCEFDKSVAVKVKIEDPCLVDSITYFDNIPDTKVEIKESTSEEQSVATGVEECDLFEPLEDVDGVNSESRFDQQLAENTEGKHSKIELEECEVIQLVITEDAETDDEQSDAVEKAKPYKCDLCDYKSERKYNLESHVLRKHCRKRPFKCGFCGHKFPTKYDLKKHNLQKHGENEPFTVNSDNRFAESTGDKHVNTGLEECNVTKDAKDTEQSDVCDAVDKGVKLNKRKQFNCNFCDHGTEKKDAFKNHCTHKKAKAKVRVTKRFKCDLCDYKSGRKYNLECHILRKHCKKRQFKCGFCGRKFATNHDLKKHALQHSENKTITVNGKSRLGQPLAESTGDKHIKAGLEDSSVTEDTEKDPEQSHTCDVAEEDVQFNKKKPARKDTSTDDCLPKLTKRRVRNVSTVLLKCNLCDYTSVRKYNIDTHVLRKHCQNRPFICELCSADFSMKYDLKRHVQYKHNKNKLAEGDDALTQGGMKIHNKVKPLKCALCDYSAARNSHLESHTLRKHCNRRPFSCEFCDHTFITKYDMKMHILYSHSDNRPFRCASCDSAFITQSRLDRHVSCTHSKEKPYQCEVCDYACVRKDVMRYHVQAKHCDDKPLKCDFCDFGAVGKANMGLHIVNKHSKEALFRCGYCVYSFVANSSRSNPQMMPFECEACGASGSVDSNEIHKI